MKTISKALTALVFSLILFACPAMACTCAAYEPPEGFERAEAVFVGKVVDTGGLINPFVVFAVEKSYKSVDTDQVTLDIEGCGTMEFLVDETYIVYAYEENGDLSTGNCTRTAIISRRDALQPFEKPENDLAFLANKETIPLTKAFYTRNVKIGATTAVVVLTLLCIGYLISKIKTGGGR